MNYRCSHSCSLNDLVNVQSHIKTCCFVSNRNFSEIKTKFMKCHIKQPQVLNLRKTNPKVIIHHFSVYTEA